MSSGLCTHPFGGPVIRLKHKKPRIIVSLLLVFLFFLSHDEMTLAVSKDELCFIKHRENQIVVTIGAL